MNPHSAFDPAPGPVATARAVAEALRVLAHQLTREQIEPDQVYDVLGGLALAASRLPHLLTLIDATLTVATDGGVLLVIDNAGGRHDPTLLLVEMGADLTAASDAARTLTTSLDAAHEHAAILARP